MAEKLTIQQLIKQAADKLNSDFEYIRKTNPHSGTKGSEVETILKKFLNNHMPKRFTAGSGFVIDNENNISKQTDIIIYDALNTALIRADDDNQIVPVNTVACVIEVKSVLNKALLRDAYEKIASVKKLKKAPVNQMDKMPTGADSYIAGSYGIIFAFSSEISMEKIAEHMEELNKEFPSDQWPNMVVVLNKGIVDYSIQFPGSGELNKWVSLSSDINFVTPGYIILTLSTDGDFTLHRFFITLLSVLTLYPLRPSSLPFDTVLQGATRQAQVFTAYQYGSDLLLSEAPVECQGMGKEPELTMEITKDKKIIGILQYVTWKDVVVLRMMGPVDLLPILAALGQKPIVLPVGGAQLSYGFKLTKKQFKDLGGNKIFEENGLETTIKEIAKSDGK